MADIFSAIGGIGKWITSPKGPVSKAEYETRQLQNQATKEAVSNRRLSMASQKYQMAGQIPDPNQKDSLIKLLDAWYTKQGLAPEEIQLAKKLPSRGAFGGIEPKGFMPSYTEDEEGNVKITYKSPSVSDRISARMGGLEPGSPEWEKLAKLTNAITSVTIGGEQGAYKTLDEANKAAMQWNKDNPDSNIEALPDSAPKGQGFIVKPKPKDQPPAEAQSQLRQINAIARRTARIAETLKPEYTGYVEGWISKAKIAAGTAPVELIQLDQNIDSLIDMTYALSGKTISDKEREVLKKRFPKLTEPDANASAKLDGFMEMLADYAELTDEQWKQLGYRSAVTQKLLERKSTRTKQVPAGNGVPDKYKESWKQAQSEGVTLEEFLAEVNK